MLGVEPGIAYRLAVGIQHVVVEHLAPRAAERHRRIEASIVSRKIYEIL